jgi:hypothetical protein
VTPESRVEVIGSLSRDGGDDVSDIDLRWSPQRALTVDDLRAILAQVDPVESLRFDPNYATSATARLVFVRFAGWPVFSRVDLYIDGSFDDRTLVGPWSQAESAIVNVAAAIKSCRRRPADADELLRRGFQRLEARDPGGELAGRMESLLSAARQLDPSLTDLVTRVREATSACDPSVRPSR